MNAEKYGVILKADGIREKFEELIISLCSKYNEKVALLIDESDKPIIDYLTDLDKAEENREILRDFYGIIKPMDPYTEFVMLTGVTKFSKVSIFSELQFPTRSSSKTEKHTIILWFFSQ